MATNKRTGLAGLISKVVKSKTAKSRRIIKKDARNISSTSKTSLFSFRTTNPGNFNETNFRKEIEQIAENITLKNKWSRLGDTSANLLENEAREYTTDSIDFSPETKNNFTIIQNEFNIISNFMIRADSKIDSLSVNVKKSLIEIGDSSLKNQVSTINTVNKKLYSFDSTIDKLSSKIETHDRQLDEIYSEIKNAKKAQQGNSFLAQKKSRDKIESLLQENEELQQENESILSSINVTAIAAGVGAAGAGSYAVVKGAGKLVSKGFGLTSRAGRAVGGIADRKVGQIAGKTIAGKLGKKLAARGAGAAIGGFAGPVILGGMILYDGYQGYKGYKKGGWKGAVDGVLGAVEEQPKQKQSSSSATEIEEINYISPNDISLVSKKDISLESKREIRLKASKIILDAANIEIKGKLFNEPLKPIVPKILNPSQDQNKNSQSSAGGFFNLGQGLSKNLNTQPESNSIATPPSSSGSNGFSSGNNISSEKQSFNKSFNNNSRTTTSKTNSGVSFSEKENTTGPARKIIEKSKSVLSDILSSKNSFGTLKQQREKFVAELEKNPELKRTMAVMAISEAGPGADASSIRGVMETMVNRAAAQGKSLGQILQRHSQQSKNYYAPYFDGAFEKRSNQLSGNKNLQDKLNSYIDDVMSGSNDSNFATDNSSAGVAASAKRSQTITTKTSSGETLSRKDRLEFSNLHGAGVTSNNAKWYNETLAAIENENKFISPKSKNIADLINRNESLIQKSKQAISDASLSRAAPDRSQFSSQREYNKAVSEYNSKSKFNRGGVDTFDPTKSNKYSVIEKQQDVAAVRTRPIDDKLRKILQYASKKSGTEIEVFSGGQAGIGEGGKRTGSTRHDHGNAADINLFVKENGVRRKLDMTNESDQKIYREVVKHARAAGATGIGGEASYMGTNSLHIGFGKEATWGAGKRSSGTPGWLRESFAEGAASPINIDDINLDQNSINSKDAGKVRIAKINDTIQSVQRKRMDLSETGTYKRKPDSDIKQTAFIPDSLSDKQKKFAVDSLKEKNPNLGNLTQIYDNKSRIIATPGNKGWTQGGPNSAGPRWYNNKIDIAKNESSKITGIQRLQNIKQTKNNIEQLHKKVADVKSKNNVAMNGSISGGKPAVVKEQVAKNSTIKENKNNNIKQVSIPEKKQHVASKQDQPKQQQVSETRKQENSNEKNRPVNNTKTYDNTADSIPEGPADDGYGEYKNCLI